MDGDKWMNIAHGILVCMMVAIVILAFASTVGTIVTHIDGRDAAEAKCRSANGSYGGGKCFKDGREV